MSNLTLEYLLLAFLGMVIHILIHILNRKNKSIPLSFGYYISDFDNEINKNCVIKINLEIVNEDCFLINKLNFHKREMK